MRCSDVDEVLGVVLVERRARHRVAHSGCRAFEVVGSVALVNCVSVSERRAASIGGIPSETLQRPIPPREPAPSRRGRLHLLHTGADQERVRLLRRHLRIASKGPEPG
jgi:hypothetical protein